MSACSPPFAKDAQIAALRGARAYRGDKLILAAKPHAIPDKTDGPMIAVRLNILPAKALGVPTQTSLAAC